MEWLVAEGIVIWRSFKKNHHPPLPGQLLATSGAFVLLGLLSEAGPEAARFSGIFGGGLVIAASFGILGSVTTNAQGNPVTTKVA